MIKTSNKMLQITVKKEDWNILDFLARYYQCSKTDLIKKCIKTSTSIKTLWANVEYNKLNDSDKKYYVKSVDKNFYLPDCRQIEIFEGAEYIEI